MKKALLFLNGDAPKNKIILNDYEHIYCCDGAYNYLEKMDITPDTILGDFDSINNVPKNINLINLPDQNYTDFEKALIEIKKKFQVIDVFGASGKEQDHFLGNLSIATKYKLEIQLTFYDEYQSYFVAPLSFKLNSIKKRKLSLIPMGEVKNVSTIGLKYNLKNDDLHFNNFISIRNEIEDDNIEITHESGDLFIFVENL